ncbi:MAG: hypothetical protein M0Z27_06250 [Thermaerobacter sp.]|nr:hypothetical protein [Thermaerobacter sp.]
MHPEVGELYQLHGEVCLVLADPQRLVLPNALRCGRRSLADLAADLEVPPGDALRHLGVMEQHSMVAIEREGIQVYVRLALPNLIRAMDILREVLAEQTAR